MFLLVQTVVRASDFVALNSLEVERADMLLRNCSLTH